MKKLTSSSWWVVVLSINSFFILASVINPYIDDFPGKQRIFNPLNLAFEMNIAVWWSTTLLILSGLIAYELFSTRTEKRKFAWLVLAIIFLSLSLDEVGSLHERVRNLPPYILFGGILFTYSFVVLYRSPDTRKSALLILVGFTLFGMTAILELLEHILIWPEWSIGIRIGLEEGIELMGTTLCLFALVPHRSVNLQNSLSLVLPRPYRMKRFSELLLILLILHLLVSLLTAYKLEIAHRGNPVVWYPAFLFLILSLEANYQSDQEKHSWMQPWGLTAIFFLVTSISSVYLISPRVTESKFYLLGVFSNFYFIFFLHLAVSNLLLFLIHRTISRTQLLVFVVSAISLFLGYISGELLIRYVVAGVYAYLTVSLFQSSLVLTEGKSLYVAKA